MDLTSPTVIKELLAKFETRPNKRLGQNFLIDKNVLNKIIKLANLKNTDTVLEVGPGIGTLTQELAKNAKQVIAVEKDTVMIKILGETLVEFKNIKIIQGDILVSLRGRSEATDEAKNYKVVANIPYYLTSPLIRQFLETKNPPTEIILMVQKEVAQRITANPPNMNLLAVSVQFYADAKIISYVSKNCFYPAPKVDSVIIKITPRGLTSRPTGGLTSPDLFFKIVKAGFSQPRKQLGGNLSKSLKLTKKETEEWLGKAGINPTQRAETLNVADWQRLVNNSSGLKF